MSSRPSRSLITQPESRLVWNVPSLSRRVENAGLVSRRSRWRVRMLMSGILANPRQPRLNALDEPGAFFGACVFHSVDRKPEPLGIPRDHQPSQSAHQDLARRIAHVKTCEPAGCAGCGDYAEQAAAGQQRSDRLWPKLERSTGQPDPIEIAFQDG